MLFNKKVLTLSIIGIVISSSVIVSKANYDNNEIYKNKNIVKSSYENTILEDGIDHVRIKYHNGEYVDMFRDTKKMLDQTDHYHENGENAISIGSDNGVYSDIKLKLSNDAIEENKKLLKMSMIESYFTEDIESGLEIDWQSSYTGNDNTTKYSSKNHNIYIDTTLNLNLMFL